MAMSDVQRNPLQLVLITVALLTFFMPIVTASLPIVGDLSWSGLNWVSQSVVAGEEEKLTPTEIGADLRESPAGAKSEVSTYARVAGLMVAAAPWTLLLSYLALLFALMKWFRGATIGPWIPRGVSVAGIYSIISFYLLADAMRRELQASMAESSRGLEDNPFAALGEAVGQMLSGSVSFGPGFGLWVFTAAALALVVTGELGIRIQRRAEPR